MSKFALVACSVHLFDIPLNPIQKSKCMLRKTSIFDIRYPLFDIQMVALQILG